MRVVELNHAAGVTVHRLGAGLIDQQSAWCDLPRGKVLIVTDRNVAGHWLTRLERTLAGHAPETLVLAPGEDAKTAAQWLRILERLAECGAQRDATVVALGGGVIGDLAGFAAASYMRGIRVVQVPTTLLAQVDAAIGGKTGFNLAAGKNLVGAFHQPAAVTIDVATLATLEEREYRAGLAEVVKYGAIRDAGFIDWLEAHATALLERRVDALTTAVEVSVRHKIEVVETDEREAGSRALLNFGHTFGHALETETGYTRFLHGEAVAIGMRLAADLSATLGLVDAAQAERLRRLLARLELPVALPDDIHRPALFKHMLLDKKNRAGRIRLVLLAALGDAVLRDDIEPDQLQEFLNP